MFLFESLSFQTVGMWFFVLGGLILLNEFARINKWIYGSFFIALPLVLSIVVWPHTAGSNTSVGTWFHWVKTYSVIIACIGFMAIKYMEGVDRTLFARIFPPAILAVNILEAVIRDFQCYGFDGLVDGMLITGGAWNIMNGIAGLLNILLICGWSGIFVGKDSRKDLLWPDMMWFWIVAYVLWNFAYVYNCVPDHAFYAGAALLLSGALPAFIIKKGAWIQNRAHTLALWMMFVMTFPEFQDTSRFAVKSSNSTTALFTVSLLALLANLAVLVYQLHVIIKMKKNPFKDELYTHLPEYKSVASNR